MTVNEFDRVILKSGEYASIADVLHSGEAYVADIDSEDGETRTELIKQSDIEVVVKPRSVS